MRAELDAFFFRLYGIDDRADAEYIITGTRRQGADDSEQGKGQHDDGEQTRELILSAYDRMAEADTAGAEYETRIYPPPGHGHRSERKPLSTSGGRDSTLRRSREASASGSRLHQSGRPGTAEHTGHALFASPGPPRAWPPCP
jgi:hypothetical protein